MGRWVCHCADRAGGVLHPRATAMRVHRPRNQSSRVSHPMRIGVPKETAEGERRVALVPDVVRRLKSAGHDVVIEPGAGVPADLPDEEYKDAGAELGDPWGAQVIARVAPQDPGNLSREQVLI